MEAVFVLRALRTPIGKYLGGLSTLSVAELGAAVVRPLVKDLGFPVRDLFFGCARQAGQGPNPARQVAIRAGLGQETVAQTINMACGSGLQALILGAQEIRLGRAQAVVVGGVESMSRVPFLLDRMRTGYRLGNAPLLDGMYKDGFHCPLADQLMGRTAETLAEKYGIPRDEQDIFALASQRKAALAWESGWFEAEVAPVAVGEKTVARDEHIRPDTTLDGLKKLPPVFKDGGTVTAGNASGITDGAAALLLCSEGLLKSSGFEPLARFEEHASAGVDPKIMGIGPVPSTRALLERTKRKISDFDLIELNEAFAAQVLACERELDFDRKRLNVHGGSIALGHPIGCTGARIVVTLLHAMRTRDARRGLATLCISGGLGLAASFSR